MKFIKLLFLISVFLLISQGTIAQNTSGNTQNKNQKFAIALHGGAGVIKKENMSEDLEKAYQDKMEEAIKAGHKILEEGGSAVMAVQTTINILENSPLFNAGKGAVLTHDEQAELDASIMDGKTLNAGAIAGVQHIKNPIDLAIEVMNSSDHVMLSGKGAEVFALEQDFDTVPRSYFVTENRLKEVQTVKNNKNQKTSVYYDRKIQGEKMGTVGAVALDKNGNLAAGTSTGGMTNKRYGRIGDSPIIGAGNYANNATCAISGTGHGEYYIRGVVAYDVSALMEYSGLSLEEATQKVIHEKQPDLGGSGGLVAMDKQGNISHEFNTPGMFRAKIDTEGNLEIGIYDKK